ncbi:hypothetical protein COE99_09425 [Bacillus toyonensis]|uniref:BglII/BstYI family type II restriction endonuclease n=1 Tax=Bacillus toyonensis TaxID=155322 RepID=UPI000BFB43E4|nr:BglII/BstYI family type II restriction endonuclease [Bacillus toyonensis]PHC09921.1 hypothetical protein COE99_09425 [Bacillus toyonensis]
MRYKIESHRNALTILENEPDLKKAWQQVKYIINSISEGDIIKTHNKYYSKSNKSISPALNRLFRERFKDWNWRAESPIFKETSDDYKGKNWRLDFVKNNSISIEVAYNHGGSIAWNLLKPVLASELNHVEKAAQTKVGIIITATTELKKIGGFDNAVGLFENYVIYLKPLMNQLTIPLLIIGLEAPKHFKIEHYKLTNPNGTKITVGKVIFKGAKKTLNGGVIKRNYKFKGRIYFRKKYRQIKKEMRGSYYKGKIK